ncbi:MAG TPA: Ig-like domain-containing protein, partial [Candidatus Kapabacteria bacterium]
MYKFYRFCYSIVVVFSIICTSLGSPVAEASQKAQISYQYPLRSAKNVFPTTGIGIRVSKTVDKRDLTNNVIRVVGSKSGVVAGSITLVDDKRTVIFTPTSQFQLGEKVTVEVGGSLPETSFDFTISSVLPRFTGRKVSEEESYLPSTPFLQLPMDT